MRAYILSLLAICISIIAFAAAVAHRSEASDESTRIEIDQTTDMVRILLDNREVAVIDRSGLYVRGDMAYSGTITDGLPARLTEGADAQ